MGRCFHRIRSIAFVLTLMLAWWITPAQTSRAQTPQEGMIQGLPVPYLADTQFSTFNQAPPEAFAAALLLDGVALNTASAPIIVDYVPAGNANAYGTLCTNFPEYAKAPFNYAASIWSSLLRSTVPIHIEACWGSLPSGVLGYSGALDYDTNFPGAPVKSIWYPVAAVNAITGTDWNGGRAEMSIAYSAAFANYFYYGVDSATPANRYSFATVVLHEIGHGLGMLGSMNVSSGIGSWGNGTQFPMIYDRYTTDRSQYGLVSYTNNSAALGSVLTGGGVYFLGPRALAANSGQPVKLYAPAPWKPGSSYVHVDEIYNNTANALMTYSLSYGETNYSPGPIALGILQDVGWTLNTPNQAPVDITISDAQVEEKRPMGTLVGLLNARDPDPGDQFSYSIVPGLGDATKFTIKGNQLLTNDVFVAAVRSSYAIYVEAKDTGGFATRKTLIIAITPALPFHVYIPSVQK